MSENIKKEKSCGAVVYKIINDQRYYLVEKMNLGHTSIPKGHVEPKIGRASCRERVLDAV